MSKVEGNCRTESSYLGMTRSQFIKERKDQENKFIKQLVMFLV